MWAQGLQSVIKSAHYFWSVSEDQQKLTQFSFCLLKQMELYLQM